MAKKIGVLKLVNRNGKPIAPNGTFIQLRDDFDINAAFKLNLNIIEAFIQNSMDKRTLVVKNIIGGNQFIPWVPFERKDLIKMLDEINDIANGERSRDRMEKMFPSVYSWEKKSENFHVPA